MTATMKYMGFESPMDAVLSGQFELCVPRNLITDNSNPDDPHPLLNWSKSFIRNASFKAGNHWSKIASFPVSENAANQIRWHKCVVLGLKGSLYHWHTRAFPAKPKQLLISG